jgi:hypothetical protein
MLSSSARASEGSSTGVCPDVTTCRGPRTEPAGLTGTIWPVTTAARRAASCRSQAAAASPQPLQLRLLDAGAGTTGIDQPAFGIIVGKQQGAEPRPATFGIGPADDDKFLAVKAFDQRCYVALAYIAIRAIQRRVTLSGTRQKCVDLMARFNR